MANVNDTNNTGGKLDNQWDMLYNADIDDRDRQAIEEFVRLHRASVENRKPTTLTADLSTLRNASKRASTPLVDMDMGDVRRLLGTLTAPKEQGGYGLDPGGSGIYGYKRALRVFFQWLDDQTDYGSFAFAEEIELSSGTHGRVDEDQLLEEEEVADLKRAARCPRDKALIEFLADSADRVSLASQLRVGDVHDLDTDRPYYTPNPEGANHKGSPDKRYPILYSKAELRSYLNHHHVDPRPEAPLWHVVRGYDHDNPQEGAMSGDRIRDMLRGCKRRAGIDKPTNPHNFRHTAITRLAREGITKEQIQHVAGWSDDRMFERYNHTTDRERNDQLRVKFGLLDEEDTTTSPQAPTICGTCREQVSPTTRFCPNCAAPVTDKSRRSAEDYEEQLFESMAAAGSDDLVDAIRTVRQLAEEHPLLKTALLDD